LAEPDGAPPDELSEVLDFSAYDLATTIRLIVLSGESRRIDVRRVSKRGSIFIQGGEIYRAESTECTSDEAFFDMLSWDSELHSDTWEADPPERNIRVATNVLLDVLKKWDRRPTY